MRHFTRGRLLLWAAAAAALAGCSETAEPDGPALSQSEAELAADVIVDDIDNELDGATASGEGAAFYTAAARTDGPAFAIAGVGGFYRTLCTPPPTVTVDGTTTTYVFDECTISRVVPLETIVRDGEIAVTRESGSRTVVFRDFTKTWTRIFFRTGRERTTSVTRNGTRALSHDGTTLTHRIYGLGDPEDTHFESVFQFHQGGSAEHRRNWQSAFTADVAGSLAANAPLPAGTWNIAGESTLTRTGAGGGVRSWALDITATDVHYDPECAAVPQFDSGTVTVEAHNAQTGGRSTFTITFTGCGRYEVGQVS